MIVGIILIFFGLCFITYITWRSRTIIDQIALSKAKTVREITEEFTHER